MGLALHVDPLQAGLDQGGERGGQDEGGGRGELTGHDDQIPEVSEGHDRRGPVKQAAPRVQAPLGLHAACIGAAVVLQVLVEPGLVHVLHAVDPDGTQQAEVFMEQAELHGGIAGGRARRLPVRTIDRAGRQPDESPQRRQEDRRQPGDPQAEEQESAHVEGDAIPEVELVEQAQPDVVDLAREQVHDRADALGRQ